MATFRPGQTIETAEPTIEVTITPESPLPVGRHRFQLVVVDDSGNKSLPDEVEVIVQDTQNPTAVLKVPTQAELGRSFTLDGRASSDVPPGKIVQYIWTMVE